jgi:chaperonin cofactor prefoldin
MTTSLDTRVWTSIGPLFIKLPQKEVIRQLQTGLDELDKQKVTTRDEMKAKLILLQEEQGMQLI